ncbi:MAG: MgtC/SapB family protein [Candidatus Yonathbacteria bacterium]|nr:MgtC/SapB family protein [Candidatus Yonathbacteria bacterium]
MDIVTLFSAQNIEIGLKLLAALSLGMSLGIERALAGKTAGMRTYGLVTMGAALFVIIGVIAAGGFDSLEATTESLRLTGQIIVGVGFLGAGLIIFKNSKVSGVTTAAGIWVSAGVGMAIGYGFYSLAVISTILILFVFTGLWYIENKLKTLIHEEEEDKDVV